MKVTRRIFLGHLTRTAAVATLAGGTLALDGCNVFSDIEAWIPTGEAAVNAILAVLTANGLPVSAGIAAIVGLIEAGFNALIAAIKEYQSTTPPPQGVVAKIQTIMQDISDQFSAFVNQLSGAAGGILKVVVALVTVIISTIGGFITKLPSGTVSITMHVGRTQVAGVQRSRRKFVSDFNAQLDTANASGVMCPKWAYLHKPLF